MSKLHNMEFAHKGFGVNIAVDIVRCLRMLTAMLVFVILLSIFALTPAPIRAHSRALRLTLAHSRSLPLTPARSHMC